MDQRVRTEFIRVTIGDKRSVLAIDRADRAPNHAIGHQSEIAAAGDRPVAAEGAHSRERRFDQGAGWPPHPHQRARKRGQAVAPPGKRENAAVIDKALVNQNIQCPQGFFHDAEARRAEAERAAPAEALQQGADPAQLDAQSVRGQQRQGRMTPAVRGNLMAGSGNVTDQRRFALGHFA